MDARLQRSQIAGYPEDIKVSDAKMASDGGLGQDVQPISLRYRTAPHRNDTGLGVCDSNSINHGPQCVLGNGLGKPSTKSNDNATHRF